MVQDTQDWSTLTGREVTEYFLLWICSPVNMLCSVPFTCCVGLQSIISGTNLSPTLIMGMLSVDLGDSQALFTSGHQHKSTEVRSHTALVIHVNPLGKYGGRLDYSLVQLPYYMPTKPTAAKARAVSTAGALVCLAVSKLLNSGSCQWKCNSEVHAVARRFQLFFGNMNPELGCGFRSNSSCVFPTGICSTGCQSTETCQAEKSQGGDQDEQATQAGGFWGSSWNMRAHQAGGSQEGHRGKQVMGEGSLGRRWWGHRSQLQLEPFLVPMDGGVSERGREAAMVVPLLACHSTVKVKALHFHFYGCPCGGFPHSHEESCLLKANSNPLPWSALQTPCPSTQSLCTLVDTCVRLGCIELWYRPSEHISLCPACHITVAVLSPEPLKLPSYLS